MLRITEEPSMLPPGVSSVTELPGWWWVAHTKSRFEKAFVRDLHSRNIGYFFPCVERLRVVGGRKRRILLPLFPSYVFFCGDEESRVTAMRTNRLCQTIPVADQQRLVSECASIEKALVGGADLELFQGLSVGRRCRVTAGPFQGIEGTVIRKDGRAQIVLEIGALGVGASLCIEADLLEPIAGPGLYDGHPPRDAGRRSGAVVLVDTRTQA